MIQYSIEFPITPTKSVEDVIRLAHEWILGSRYTGIKGTALDHLPIDTEVAVSIEGESVTTGTARMNGVRIGGVKWTRVESNGLEWTTTIVVSQNNEQIYISIQVLCEALNTATHLPEPKKPVFVKQVLARIGGGMDGQIPVTDKPFFLTEQEVAIAAALVSGIGGNRLPIIYISSTYVGGHIVDPILLAKELSGMGHVIVEPSRAFSARLRELVDSRNVYGGTLGVYWPESNSRRSYYLEDSQSDANSVFDSVVRDVRVALANRRQRADCGWSFLKEAISHCKIEALKSSDSNELNEYVKLWDIEKEAKNKRIAEAENEIAKLTSEIKRQNTTNQGASSGLLRRGKEQDLYEGEILNLVIETLRAHQSALLPGSRRDHVISDLIATNSEAYLDNDYSNQVRNIFKTYVSMDAKTRSALKKLGFDLSEDGKHHKLIYQGDGRYTFAVSKTSSDHRAGKNIASDIVKKIF